MLIYYNTCNFWLLSFNYKIVPSTQTLKDLKIYKQFDERYCKKDLSLKDYHHELTQNFIWNRVVEGLTIGVFANYDLLMTAMLLFISVFNQSVIALGYFIFSCILIFKQLQFFALSEV